MKCFRHHDRDAVGVCAGCGKAVCAETCAQDGEHGLHCSPLCADRLRARAPRPEAPPGLFWPMFLIALGGLLLYYGYHYSEWTMSVPNVLGMLFVWYGVVLWLQRLAQRRLRRLSAAAQAGGR